MQTVRGGKGNGLLQRNYRNQIAPARASLYNARIRHYS